MMGCPRKEVSPNKRRRSILEIMSGTPPLSSVELFSGAGGLALGVAAAGFEHRLLLEYNKHACDTLRENRSAFGGGCEIHEGDVKTFDFSPFAGVDLLAAGAPCQPFSIGGRHKAHTDERNLFPQVFRAQREIRPKAVIIENVKGLLRASLSTFVEFIELQLAHPTILPDDPLAPDGWEAHLPALRTAHNGGDESSFRYVVHTMLLNSANFGVPQRRERVFFVALRTDLDADWIPPVPTHSQAALRLAMDVTADYWGKHGIVRKPQPNHPHLGKWLREAGRTLPWTTVRDVISDLPTPVAGKQAPGVFNHVGQPGAKSYPGHTGSPMDAPGKTLKAGVHGVPGGENMLRNTNGTVRYFTVREAARIQTFPDTYVLKGAWGEAMRQIGNAVPVALARAVASSVRESLERAMMANSTQVVLPQTTRARRLRRASVQQELLPTGHFRATA
jgi:DNA (cytosine-5)-methyltransferase 1